MAIPTSFSGPVPACATKEQYLLWREAARQYSPAPKVGFCEDCTAQYQAAMIEQNRCENVHVWFTTDDDGFEHGTTRFRGVENADA
jgi:hypothetical protein